MPVSRGNGFERAIRLLEPKPFVSIPALSILPTSLVQINCSSKNVVGMFKRKRTLHDVRGTPPDKTDC